MSRLPPRQYHSIISGLLLSALVSVFSLAHADTSWPVAADGAEAAGFAPETITRLDAAMGQIVSDNDVAGMVWLLAKGKSVV